MALVAYLCGLVGATRRAYATDATDEWDFAGLVNKARYDAGLGPLGVLSGLRDMARAQSGRMAQRNTLYHNPNLATDAAAVAPDWQRAGENVGQGSDVAGLHDAFMASPHHRDNILGDFNYAGLGVVHANGRTWVTEVFLKAGPDKPLLTRVPVTRLAGASPGDTSLAISRAQFPAGQADGVVVTRADVFADALAGAPLAAANRGPVVLTASASVSNALVDEAQRVLKAAGTVYLLGGVAALSPTVEAAFVARGLRVTRVAGADRYETATLVAGLVNPAPDEVLLTSGTSFADASVAGAPAALERRPIVLTEAGRLPPPTAAYLATVPDAHRVVVGGVAAVSDAVAAAASSDDRVAGADRYETSVRVAERFFPAPPRLSVATGASFADALAASPFSGPAGAPVVLVSPTPTPPTYAYVRDRISSLTSSIVVGGPADVPAAPVTLLFT